ncbi:MAG: glycosyltransferase family 4 protein [Sulfuricurvum sp.]|nr:glycosyltransferase family 4 protein [Sulfuricurvum sp.]
MTKQKLLCILHRSPPAHGAAKVGDYIASSEKLREAFECRFITIKSSDTIGDIGKVNFKKFYLVAELYVKVLWALITFRPDLIYFTASIRSVAFYRDLFLSTLWKLYKRITPVEVFYHYHTKGVNEFVSLSSRNLSLTRFFLDNINLVILSPMLEDDFKQVRTYKSVSYLPNGVEDTLDDGRFQSMITARYANPKPLNILYLSNMIKSKGYFHILELANQTKDRSVHYHFAGGWQNDADEKEFFDYIHSNTLSNAVTFHGFVNGEQKRTLFENAHLFIFPTRYENEAFPLSLLEAMSYGLPSVATDEGSIPYILDTQSGVIIYHTKYLNIALDTMIKSFVNPDTANYCRQRYLTHFTQQQFEQNFIRILKATS